MKFKRILALLTVLMLLLSVTAFSGCKDDNATVDNSIKFDRVENSTDGYAAIYMPDNRPLKILQLTDPQVDTSKKYSIIGGDNDQTYVFIEALLTAVKPDFVIITGDLVMANIMSNQRELLRYADVLEKFNIPWTITFGNHDSEGTFVALNGNDVVHDVNSEEKTLFGQISKKHSVELLSAYPHCLLSMGDNEGSTGDNFINIKAADGTILHTVCTFDTAYEGDFNEPTEVTYARTVTEEQLAWYEENIAKISDLAYGTDRASDKVVPSYVYQHVGVPEFRLAWNEAWDGDTPNEKYFYGDCPGGDYSEYISEDDFINTAAKIGSTKAVFYGHHHDNDASVEYKGIRLTFGQHSGFSHTYRLNRCDDTYKFWDFTAYDKYGDKRGGTMLSIDADGGFVIAPQYAKDLIPNYATDFAINVDEVEKSLIENGSTVYRWTEADGKVAHKPAE
jgi:DNA repair exonuclease